MSRYYTAYEPDLGFYPNYSFAVGDMTGDGKQELIGLTTDGNLVRVLDLQGRVLLEHTLKNYGDWGTVIPVLGDVDSDGRQELIIPDGPPGNVFLIALNIDNETIRERRLESREGDDYGIAVPLLGTFRRDLEGHLGISVALAGGTVCALDSRFQELWRREDMRHDFGHEFYNCDVNNDEVDEIIFCTVDHINQSTPDVNGDLVILRGTDGGVYVRQPVREIVDDTHFDDIVVADFRGIGQTEILVEKGILLNLQGDVIWDVSDELEHGQWITTAPNPDGPGLVAFISELWSEEGLSKLISPSGETLWELTPDRHTRLNPQRFPGFSVLPTRAHAVDWFNDGNYEIVLGEQISGPSGHACYEEMTTTLKLFFFDLAGNLLHELPFPNTCEEGFWYNGEVPSCIGDVDGDGYPEWVFPRQGGQVMVVKKEL